MYTNSIENYNLNSVKPYVIKQNTNTLRSQFKNPDSVSFSGSRKDLRVFLFNGPLYTKLFKHVLDNPNGLGKRTVSVLNKNLNIIDYLINRLEAIRLKSGTLLDYDKLKKRRL